MPDAQGSRELPDDYDFAATTRLLRTGERDPTFARLDDGFVRAAHTDAGPATVEVHVDPEAMHASAWGPGAARALADLPRWTGIDRPPWSLPSHPVTDRMLREHPGLRLTDTRDVFEAVVNLVLQQLVTWREAAMTWRRLVEGLGDPAPGPHGLRLSPTPEALRGAGTARLQGFGIGSKRARTLMEVARAGRSLQRLRDLPTDEALRRMQSVRGVGPWTAASVAGMRMGRPEPVLLGDFHLPHTVSWALAGEPRGSDARMVELLAPFEGQAFRVLRLIHAAGVTAPKRGPRRGFARHRR